MEINNYEYTDGDSSWRVLIRYATVQTKLNNIIKMYHKTGCSTTTFIIKTLVINTEIWERKNRNIIWFEKNKRFEQFIKKKKNNEKNYLIWEK